MLRVSQLFIKNIGPFSKEIFDFSIQKGHPDIHIFTGQNGSGKTSLLHAIASSFDLLPENHNASQYTTNHFYKRFHFFKADKNDKEMPKSYAHSIIATKEADQIIEKIITYGCTHCSNLHQMYERSLRDNKVAQIAKSYKTQANNKELKTYKKNAIYDKTPSQEGCKFAVFGYSGYRLINSAQIKFNSDANFNPLHLALDFTKKTNDNATISNWIISRYSKAAIEETHGNKVIAQKYREALNCLIKSIGQLTNEAYTFEVKTNPWKVVIKHYEKEIEFDVLPDGLRSILSWLGDLLMRLDEIPWANKSIPVNHQAIILLLDEIEVHLHPKWQYEILPLTKMIFPNAQIFLSTHSPFVLNSIDNAKVYKLQTENGNSKIDRMILSNTGDSYSYIFEHILDTTHTFGPSTTKDLQRFNEIDQEIINEDFSNEEEFKTIINRLRKEGEEVTATISSKLFRLKRVIGKNYLNGKNY